MKVYDGRIWLFGGALGVETELFFYFLYIENCTAALKPQRKDVKNRAARSAYI